MSPSSKQRSLAQAGLPVEGEPAFLAIGRIGKPHGVKGELRVHLEAGELDWLAPGRTLHLGVSRTPFEIRQIRGAPGQSILSLVGIEDRNAAAQLRNLEVFIPSADLPDLPEGAFYAHDLIGMQVLVDTGDILGDLIEVLATGANEVFVIRSPTGEERLLPVIEDVVLSIDVPAGKIFVRLMDEF